MTFPREELESIFVAAVPGRKTFPQDSKLRSALIIIEETWNKMEEHFDGNWPEGYAQFVTHAEAKIKMLAE